MTFEADGAALFEIVAEYAALGDHRSGTLGDGSTAAWVTSRLARLGLMVGEETVPFDRWVAESTLTCDGVQITHLPLATGWTGTVAAVTPAVIGFDPARGGRPDVVDEPLGRVHGTAAAAVLATEHPHGALVGVNRDLAAPSGTALPAVLVAGRDLDRLRNGTVRLTMTARTEPGATTNVVADTPAAAAPGARPVILTTPMHGWFTCAGERGTGLAVLLHLAERIAAARPDLPLRILVTGGHELTYLGAHAYVDAHPVPPAAVVHVGASVAVEEDDGAGGRRLIPTRFAMTSVDAATAATTADALAVAQLTLAPDVTRFTGEGEAFVRWGAPLLSSTGAGVDFHTPDDVPARVTSPAALARVADAYLVAALAFLDAVGAG